MNNKGEKILVFALGALVAGLVFFLLTPKANGPIGGVDISDPSYTETNITLKSVACASNAVAANNTGTVIFGPSVGRLMFEAQNNNLTAVAICRFASACRVASSTRLISATTSVDMPINFVEEDGYGGAYTCSSDGATTTISVQQAL